MGKSFAAALEKNREKFTFFILQRLLVEIKRMNKEIEVQPNTK